MTEQISQLQDRLRDLQVVFALDHQRVRLADLESQMASPDFWHDQSAAARLQREHSQVAHIVSQFSILSARLDEVKEFAAITESGDDGFAQEVAGQIEDITAAMEQLEFRRMLSGELDGSSAIVSINSGAGGTEAQDWVQMLLRMYLRWSESRNFKTQIVDSLPGEEAGLKNVTFTVEGDFAYGYLQAEQGIHRLVRISPFDANARRHTSFASVAVLPQLAEDVEVEILDDDLRIDTYRSSGAGGQHVNTTDSAVRITHLPTGIVAACQGERSQHKNKAQAMKVLKARLFEHQRVLREKELEQRAGEKKDIAWGSQIRSYTLQPYQLIKDHRTDMETGKVAQVLDGDLDGLIRAYLLHKSSVPASS